MTTSNNEKKVAKAKAKIAKVEEEIEEISKSLNTMIASKETNVVVGAFVMFHSEKAQQDALRHYASKDSRSLPCTKPRSEFMLEGRTKLQVRPVVWVCALVRSWRACSDLSLSAPLGALMACGTCWY